MTKRSIGPAAHPPSRHPADDLTRSAGRKRDQWRRQRMAASALAIVAYSVIGAVVSPDLGSGALTVEAGDARVLPLSSGASVGLDFSGGAVVPDRADTGAGARGEETAHPVHAVATVVGTFAEMAAESVPADGTGTVAAGGGSATRAAPVADEPEPAPAPSPPTPEPDPDRESVAPEAVSPVPVTPAAPPAPATEPTVIAVHAAPAAAPSGSAEEAIATFFLDVYDQAVTVATCESGLDPAAVSSGGGNHGLFQINNVHRAAFEAATGTAFDPGVYDPYLNAQFARQLFDGSGWEPWACQP